MITFFREPTGKVPLGLFVVGVGAFALSVLDRTFWPFAFPGIAGGIVCAAILFRRHALCQRLSIQSEAKRSDAPKPIR